MPKVRNYIIDDEHNIVPQPDLRMWAEWYETADRHVGFCDFGDMKVSTVFLGMDHSWDGSAPMLFETMVFERNRDPGLELDYVQSDDFEMWRYSTWAQAEAGHEKMCELVRAAQRELEELNALLKQVKGL